MVIFGHGFGDSQWGGATAVAPTLAKAGFATIATMVAFPLFVAFAWIIPARLTGAVVGVMAFFQGALLVAVLIVAVHPVLVPLVP